MNTHTLGFSALLFFFLAACGGGGSGESSKPTGSGKPSAVAGAKGATPAAIPQNPEENYVAAAVKIGCLGLNAADADGLAKDRAAVLKEHNYTEDSWKVASKQLGASKGDAIVKAMEATCPE